MQASFGRTSTIVLALLCTACADGDGVLEPPTAALFSCALGDAIGLEVGGVIEPSNDPLPTLCVRGGTAPAEFLYVPFLAIDDGTVTLTSRVAGGGIVAAGQVPASAVVPGAASLGAPAVQDDWRFHRALRERERAHIAPLMQGARRARTAWIASSAAGTALDVPAIGELMDLNVAAECNARDVRTGRVEAVSASAIVIADTANPAGGFSRAQYDAFATTFDTLVFPVDVANFGEPTDIDANDRVLIFFTAAVNELTPPGSESFVGGFFWGGDLLPADLCGGSNVAEMFYLLVPDPQGALGNVRSVQFVERVTVGAVAHEFQHLINAGRRIYVNDANEFEELWLNEGLSHIAEELVFYAASGLSPRSNLDLAALTSSQHITQSFVRYGASNLARLSAYLEDPEQETLLGVDNLATRGASWAFLRYAADLDPGEDDAFFHALVNSTEAGVVNLRAVLDEEPTDRMRTWTVSVFTDDAVPGVPPVYTQPSWNFRSVVPALTGSEDYPLDLVSLTAGTASSVTLHGGGAAFVRFGVSERGVISVQSADRNRADDLRITLVRVR